MRKIVIITLFPNMFENFISTSIIKKAIEKEKISISTIDIRQFSGNKHQQVDDYPYGGGSGMVMQALPIIHAIDAAKAQLNGPCKTILLSAQGKTWSNALAYEYSNDPCNLIMVCGHYEGIDERIMGFIDQELSIGDYVLTGGEIPAMVICDSIIRLIPEVIKLSSHQEESFNNGLLDYATYTRPEVILDNLGVPKVLVSGHHKEIEKYRQQSSLINTYKKRPDLLKEYLLSDEQKTWIKQFESN